jgi:hypothetical protein
MKNISDTLFYFDVGIELLPHILHASSNWKLDCILRPMLICFLSESKDLQSYINYLIFL